MAVTLIAVIAALAISHLAPSRVAGLRGFGWYRGGLRWLSAQFPDGSLWRGRFGIVLALLLPMLVVGGLQFALNRPFAQALPSLGLVGLLFDTAVLVWCWGPRDLDRDVAAIIDAPDADTRRAAAARLWPAATAVRLDGPSLVEAVFRNALQRWFAVLFWFLLLGPFGALLYRLSALAVEHAAAELPPTTASGARLWLAALEWPVAQLATLTLALVGNFGCAVGAWRESGAFALHTRVLLHAARASVRCGIAEEVADYADSGLTPTTAIAEVFGEMPELRDAMLLAWRILILWLAVIALLVVAGWAG
jgi:AmpE protein